MSAQGSTTASSQPILPPELVTDIFEYVDRSNLLSLGLVCRHFVYISRNMLFTCLNFEGQDRGARKFDRFLLLIASPHTTIARPAKILRINNAFNARGHVCRERGDTRTLAAKLRQLTRIELIDMAAILIPRVMLEFISHLPAKDILLDSLGFHNTQDILLLWERFPQTKPRFTLYNIYLSHIDRSHCDVLKQNRRYFKNLHLAAIDSVSLSIFNEIWDPYRYNDINVVVESLFLQLPVPPRVEADKYLQFLGRFLSRVGSGINSFYLNLIDVANLEKSSLGRFCRPVYNIVGLSKCVNVTTVGVGIDTVHGGSSVLAAAMWSILKSLPSSKVQNLMITCDSRGELDADLDPWVKMCRRMKAMFSALKQIRFLVIDNDAGVVTGKAWVPITQIRDELRDEIDVTYERYTWRISIRIGCRLFWLDFSTPSESSEGEAST